MTEPNTPEQNIAAPEQNVEAQRVAISSDPAWYDAKSNPQRHKELVGQMQALIKGQTAPPPAPATKPQQEAPPQSPTQQKAEARLAEMRKDQNYWSSADPAKHKALMDEQRQLMAALATDDEAERVASLPVEKLREQYGVDLDVLPHIRDNWSSEGEATLLGTLAVAGAPPEGVRALHGAYVTMFNDALGASGNVVDVPAQVENFRAIGKRHGVPSDVLERMIAAELVRLGFKS